MKSKVNVIQSAILVICVFSVIVLCDLDRRDIHRIVLKPQRSKKHHKKHSSSKDPLKYHHRYHESDYEPQATQYESEEVPHRYRDKHRYQTNNRYHNHHEHYHDLMKPRPPKRDNFVISYPEEEQSYEYQESSSNRYASHNKPESTENWAPISSHNNAAVKNPHHYEFTSTSAPVIKKKKKKPRRKSTEKPAFISESIEFTTSKPSKQPASHFLNYNHNNKSIIKYEVNKFSNIYPTTYKPARLHSYEVYEEPDDVRPNKQPFHNFSPLSSYSFRGHGKPASVSASYIPKQLKEDYGSRVQHKHKPKKF